MDENLPTNIDTDDKTPTKIQSARNETENKFIELLFEYAGHTPTKAALEAGYSESYAKNIKWLKLRDPKFQAKIKEQYNGSATFLLPTIFKSECDTINIANQAVKDIQEELSLTDDLDKRIELSEKALSLLAKPSNTRKELKQAAGVLSDDKQYSQTTVNIGQIQQLFQANHASTTEDIVNSEVDDWCIH